MVNKPTSYDVGEEAEAQCYFARREKNARTIESARQSALFRAAPTRRFAQEAPKALKLDLGMLGLP